MSIAGAGEIDHGGKRYPVGRGDVFLLPAEVGECSFRPGGRDVSLLEIALPESARDRADKPEVRNSMKKLVVFDLDGTLAQSKSSIDSEMAGLLGKLVGTVKAAIISGGDWPQFAKQVLSHLGKDVNLANLSILPTCGTKFYRYEKNDGASFTPRISPTRPERRRSSDRSKKAIDQSGQKAEKVWGETIEDRGSQITYSALGQQAPLERKEEMGP